MPIPELASLLPARCGLCRAAERVFSGRRYSSIVKLAMRGALDKLVTEGTLSLDNTRLAHFDMGKKLKSFRGLRASRADPITGHRSARSQRIVAPEGTTADNLQLIVPAIGALEGGGGARRRCWDLESPATVHTSGLLAAAGNTPIPFTVEGPASEPVFRPDIESGRA